MKRGSYMIARDILGVARGGSGITRLVYQTNLNFKVIKTHLSKLIERGLLECIEGHRKTWITTDKGLSFILAMEGVKSLWDCVEGSPGSLGREVSPTRA